MTIVLKGSISIQTILIDMLQKILYATIGIYFAYYICGVMVTAIMSKWNLHAKLARLLPWITIAEICVIEACIILSKTGNSRNYDSELKIHIWLASITLICIFVQWWFDGYKKPKFHKKFHFLVTLLFLFTTITGIKLIDRL